jgi:predicted peptidase
MRPSLLAAMIAALVSACKGSDSKTNGEPTTPGDTTQVPVDTGHSVAEAGTFVKKSVTTSGVSYPYQVFVPKSYNTSRKSPMIVFVGGGAERGSDGDKQTMVGLGPVVRAQAATFPSIVLFPQLPAGEGMSHAKHREVILAAIDAAKASYNVDPARMYITGISFGSGIVWEFAHEHPTSFAAIVSVATVVCDSCVAGSTFTTQGSSYAEIARALSAVPVWMFHGAVDPQASLTLAHQLQASFVAQGGTVQFTEFPGVGHNAWDPAYATSGLYEWLFAQHR